MRLGTAGFVGDGVATFKRPAKTLELYEFQACPFCRKVSADLGTHSHACCRHALCSLLSVLAQPILSLACNATMHIQHEVCPVRLARFMLEAGEVLRTGA